MFAFFEVGNEFKVNLVLSSLDFPTVFKIGKHTRYEESSFYVQNFNMIAATIKFKTISK